MTNNNQFLRLSGYLHDFKSAGYRLANRLNLAKGSILCNCSIYFRILIAVIVLFMLFSCNNNSGNISTDVVNNPNTASGEVNMDDLPVIEFENDFHDFGKVVQGEIVTYGFRFKNTGKSDLIISQVNTTCGCTVPEYPKTPIKPGEEKFVKVKFDSSGRKGIQNKSATVVTNCQPSSVVVRIRAQVIAL